MRKSLLVISAAALVGLVAPASHASLIPNLTSEGIVVGGADFTYSVELSADQEIDTTHGFTNFLTLSGGALGPATTLVPNSETGFLTGFVFSTGANSITLTCPVGGSCSSDINGDTTANFTIFSPATGIIAGTFNARATKNDPNPNVDETATTNSGLVSVPGVQAAAVPEPTSLALFGTAIVGFGVLRRRRGLRRRAS